MSILSASASASASADVAATTAPAEASDGGAAPAIVLPDTLVWFSPPGSPQLRAAWMLGSESEPGRYVLRVKLAAGGRIPPHVHPDARVTTVLSGTLHVGFGSSVDATSMVAVPAGAVYEMPANTPHHLAAPDGDVAYQESGSGPTSTLPFPPQVN